MRSKKTVRLNFLMDELINGIELANGTEAKRAVVFSGTQLSTIMGHNGSIVWGFWSYSVALLSRTPTNEGYTDR